jgi:hypothetical protein
MGLMAPFQVHGVAGPSYEAESVTLFAAMSVQPDVTRKGHINTLVAALKTAGVWTKLDILYLLAAHDAQAARLNWKVPASFAATAVNSPTFTVDRGYAGDGATSYLNTGFVPSSNGVTYTRDSAHMAFWDRVNEDIGNSQIAFNASTGHVFGRLAGSTYARINGNAAGIATTSSLGLIVGDRSSSGTVFAYRNGSSIGSVSDASVAIPAGTIQVGGYTGAGFSTHQLAAASAGGTLSAGEHTAYYNAIAAYMTAVGA